MRQAAPHAAGQIRMGDAPEPRPVPGESLVRVTSVGGCGSDLPWFSEEATGDAVLDRALVLGHEMAGVVVSGPLEGQTVAVDPAS